MKKVVSVLFLAVVVSFASTSISPTKSYGVNIYKYKNCLLKPTDRCGGKGNQCGVLTSCKEVNQ